MDEDKIGVALAAVIFGVSSLFLIVSIISMMAEINMKLDLLAHNVCYLTQEKSDEL